MWRKPPWHWLFPLLAAVSLVALVTVLAERREPEVRPEDPRYFHAHPGAPDGFLAPDVASLQAKGVAASRHVPLQDVRRLVAGNTEGGESLPIGDRRVDLHALNRALDEQWPIK